ncbi:MAG: radical SAM protein [Candidatus Nanoarchaeia archaeon]|nr:radical SAM protein [Candidatus Nanoarchaeia archaeon]MDD5587623.1 radical SAM protein [Candidatus Nanoarchaeia archaeon]
MKFLEKPKILLIVPPIKGDLNIGIDNIKVPLGLCYLAGFLEKHDYAGCVKILDAHAEGPTVKISENLWYSGMPLAEIKKYLLDYQPDVVGIHCSFTVYEKDTFELAALIKSVSKQLKKHILIVTGGAHSSANPESVLKCKDIDIVVKGEGEVTFYEIVSKYYKKGSLFDIEGTVLRHEGQIRYNKPRALIKNLDQIPFPARHLLKMELYLKHHLNSIGTMRKPATDIVTSRGCTGDCVFCSIKTIWGKSWRGRSAKNVVDEIEELVNTYGVKQIRIQDDNVSYNKERMNQICDEIISRKLHKKIRWDTPNGIAIWTLDEPLLRKMKKSGYYRIAFGIESGSEDTIKFIRKPINYDYVKKIIKICNKVGLWTISPFIIGFPYENMIDIQKTINFASHSGLDFVLFYIAQPYAGTELYNIYEKENLMPKGIQMSSSVESTKYDTKYFAAKDLINLRNMGYKQFYRSRIKFYLNPINVYYFFKKCGNIEGFIHIIKMLKSLMGQNFQKR